MGNFTVTPTWVYPVDGEVYNVLVTQQDYFKRDYYLLSVNPNRSFRLVFEGLSDEKYGVILNHWKSSLGKFSPFYWKSVPSYIDAGNGSGVSIYGRWAQQPVAEPQAKSWNVEMAFSVIQTISASGGILLETAASDLDLESGEDILLENQ